MSQHCDPDRDDLGILQELIDEALQDAPDEAQWQTARRNLAAAIESKTQGATLMNTIGKFRSARLGWAVGAALTLAVVALVVFNPFETRNVYAQVAEQLRTAHTMTYRITVKTAIAPASDDAPGVMSVLAKIMPQSMVMDLAFKEPGRMRMSMPGGVVGVMDLTSKRGITIMPAMKQYIEMDFNNAPGNMPPNGIEQMRRLPEKADAVLGQREIDGRTVQDYKATNAGVEMILSVDARTGDLVQMKGKVVNMSGMEFEATDFKFDVPLDDSLFSLTPPADYKRLPISVDATPPGEQDLAYTLRWWVERSKAGTFPPSVNPLEVAGAMSEIDPTKGFSSNDPDFQTKLMQETMKTTRGWMFIMQLDARTDWHYAGKGVKLGEKEKPIFWYKPVGSATYRVLYGDLNFLDVAADQAPRP